jgi:hypothetical protein
MQLDHRLLVTGPSRLDKCRAYYRHDVFASHGRSTCRSGNRTADRGAVSPAGCGVNLWVEVQDERTALITLAAAGIRVNPGGPFIAAPLASDHIRVHSVILDEGTHELADHIARAALDGRPPTTPRPRGGSGRAAPATTRR